MIASIILAAGKGTRLKSKTINKVALPFLGKPIIAYGVEAVADLSSKTVIVVGAFSESVKSALKGYKNVLFAKQSKRLGTAHAAKMGLQELVSYKPSMVMIGMGDHMMFYKKTTIKKLVDLHKKEKAILTFATTFYHRPNQLAWGRIERDRKGNVLDIVEQKDANVKQKKIKEVNPGFYCFDFNFVKKNIAKIKKSSVTGEYYLTDLVRIAVKGGDKVIGMPVRFREVGIGINKREELQDSQKLYKKLRG